MCHVGLDVGTNTTAPKILMERLGWTLNEAAFATSLYFCLLYTSTNLIDTCSERSRAVEIADDDVWVGRESTLEVWTYWSYEDKEAILLRSCLLYTSVQRCRLRRFRAHSRLPISSG